VADPKAAAIRIAGDRQAIERVAQTSLREMIGSTALQKLPSNRKTADELPRAAITAKTSTRGVIASSVEIKDVVIPRELQDAMSRQARAEPDKDAEGDARLGRECDHRTDPGSGEAARQRS
jgi:regulator of protease activity HflC (stomatin/prohibitin superfamily)